jgi:hypothetical protein
MIHVLAIALIWAGLMTLFIVRFTVIMGDLSRVILPGRGLLKIPSVDVRPIKRLTAWVAELILLVVWYDLFGMSIAAHLAASFCAVALMFLLRDRSESNILRGLQILPMS